MQSTPFYAVVPTDRIINNWLNDRQNVIVNLNDLCNLRPFSAEDAQEEIAQRLQIFCQKLVDYISLGHFTIFEKIMFVTELSHHPMAGIPHHVLESLRQTTNLILDFNDHFQTTEHFSSLEQRLSSLTETLAQRLEWEDKLIEKYSLAKTWILDGAKIA